MTAVIIALLTMGGSIFGSIKASDAKVYDVRKDVAVNSTLISESTKRMDRLENKIDWLIQHQGGNPAIIESDRTLATSTAIRK